ncbi:hypothetical protein LCGC14_0446900 [marine sediment metagenome]|uniref:Nudix hydrolase domain-containing protein n=1 Tax=marine sediment metagenome TaxID=412755 RepID=A0A0F9SPQ3_9ZZZZ
MKTIEYVVGFLFDSPLHDARVVLITKNHPEWQAGHRNGIGGKIEPGESGLEAMRREFREEAEADVIDWEHFCTIHDTGHETQGVVHFYRSFAQVNIRSMTDEQVLWTPIKVLHNWPIMPNLRWLIPMALQGPDGLVGNVWPYVVRESDGVV